MSEPATALEMFDHRVATDPEAVFLVTPDGVERSYETVAANVDALASSLADRRVEPGEAVLLHLWNEPAWVIATLACWRLGAVVVCCGGQSPPAEAARRAVLTGARVFIVADDLDGTGPGAVRVDSEGVTGERSSGAPESAPLEAVAAVFFTSGTTGEPKPVRLTHDAIAAGARSTAGAYSRHAEFRPRTADADTAPAVTFNPFGHAAPLGRVVFRVYVGRPVVLVRRFDVDTMRTLAARYRFDTLQLTPAMIHALAYADDDIDLPALRYVTAGTAPLPEKTRDAFEDRYGAPVLSAYGSTEGTVTALERLDDVKAGRRGPGSVGRVSDRTPFRIVDDDDNDVEVGETGELLGRARPESGVPVDLDGWHHTGDLAHLDADEILYIDGRKDDRLIVGGFNVEPAQVEAVIRRHPAVRDVVVVGVEDDRLGDRPVAGIVAASVEVPVDEVVALCRSGLEAYKVPRDWFELDELPLTANGKLDRRRAAEIAGDALSARTRTGEAT
ncbi:MAG: class I adenylate-forming enzyme family protein [Actinomycetota bacterium]